MECAEVQELLSSAADGAPTDAVLAVEARRHCDTCSSCRVFRDVLALTRRGVAPRAPEALREEMLDLSRDEARIRRASVAAGLPDAAGAGTPASQPPTRTRIAWTPRFTAYAAAAAAVVVLMVAVGISATRPGQQKALDDAAIPEAADQLTGAAAPSPEASDTYDDGRSAAAEAAAPAYVTLNGRVFRLAGSATAEASTLTTAGVVTSTWGGVASPTDLPAYYARSDSSRILVKQTGGGFASFEAVVRTLGDARYQLASGVLITSYGEWPTLPPRFTTPASADGTPTFRFFGVDDSGVQVYVPVGGRAEDGFAVAPGTLSGDPAAGNPGWTWWEPMR